MIERPWGITAFSSASVQAPPDLARLRFRVSRLQQTPAEAFAVTREAVGDVRRVIRERGVPDGSVQRSQLSLAGPLITARSVRGEYASPTLF
jgi:uncharacterized protein YggE